MSMPKISFRGQWTRVMSIEHALRERCTLAESKATRQQSNELYLTEFGYLFL